MRSTPIPIPSARINLPRTLPLTGPPSRQKIICMHPSLSIPDSPFMLRPLQRNSKMSCLLQIGIWKDWVASTRHTQSHSAAVRVHRLVATQSLLLVSVTSVETTCLSSATRRTHTIHNTHADLIKDER